MSEVVVKMNKHHIKVAGGEYVQDIVRCKECKNKPVCDEDDDWVSPPRDEDGNAVYKCPCICDADAYYSYIPDDDFFCKNGEK